MEKKEILLKIENGCILLDEKANNERKVKIIQGKEELFLSIYIRENKS